MLTLVLQQKQVECDPTSCPYYYQCLQWLAEGRRSECLDTKVAVEASKERISMADIKAAYKELGLDSDMPGLDDDTIIGTFQSRISDAPLQETDMRRALCIIGQERSSERIQIVASQGTHCSSRLQNA